MPRGVGEPGRSYALQLSTAALSGFLCFTPSAIAADDAKARGRDFWVGASATDGMWLIYTGGTVAVSGDLYADGWRLRAGSGYGQYDYRSSRDKVMIDFEGSVAYLDALVGYQKQWGPLTAKAFVGLAAIEHRLMPVDPFANAGLEYGPKVLTELWYDAGKGYWASIDASFTTAHDTIAVRGRVGLRLTPEISIGPELDLNDNAVDPTSFDSDALGSAYRRGGGFLTYSWGGGEVSVSGGMAEDADGGASPYATLNLYSHF